MMRWRALDRALAIRLTWSMRSTTGVLYFNKLDASTRRSPAMIVLRLPILMTCAFLGARLFLQNEYGQMGQLDEDVSRAREGDCLGTIRIGTLSGF